MKKAESSHSDEALAKLPFPEYLCHQCDAPPRYNRSKTSIFILCPRLAVKYPRQPVLTCPGFRQEPRSTLRTRDDVSCDGGNFPAREEDRDSGDNLGTDETRTAGP